MIFSECVVGHEVLEYAEQYTIDYLYDLKKYQKLTRDKAEELLQSFLSTVMTYLYDSQKLVMSLYECPPSSTPDYLKDFEIEPTSIELRYVEDIEKVFEIFAREIWERIYYHALDVVYNS